CQRLAVVSWRWRRVAHPGHADQLADVRTRKYPAVDDGRHERCPADLVLRLDILAVGSVDLAKQAVIADDIEDAAAIRTAGAERFGRMDDPPLFPCHFVEGIDIAVVAGGKSESIGDHCDHESCIRLR